ncbi:choline-binding protein [Lactobacillus sp. ESL0731]|uniref:choline-binding protein n=1 Tax=unclassified Lactobacillus TaxID=2620435 RepID=UPI0023F86936|nr:MULTISPECIES: choline-binding protein [unclassified Lactobacillus]WEV50625.1 choline-binding protein [Lactobacillus sp. ESL0700]WEV61755.1 choline-binding protein [Lactobacillus sp. ESL0731]
MALSGATVVGAATGKWSVSQETVSAHGKWSTYGYPNEKRNNSEVASFNGDAIPNSLGYTVHLINNKAKTMSGNTGLYKDYTTYGDNNTGMVGRNYYADVRSKALEPNQSTVRLHFSADRK